MLTYGTKVTIGKEYSVRYNYTQIEDMVGTIMHEKSSSFYVVRLHSEKRAIWAIHKEDCIVVLTTNREAVHLLKR